MRNTVEVDLSKLGTKVSELVGVLLGRGYGQGDAQNALRIEAGQCAWKIAEATMPDGARGGSGCIVKRVMVREDLIRRVKPLSVGLTF